MYVTYPVNNPLQSEAVKMAVNLARASGYKQATVARSVQTGPSSWDITLVVM